MQLLNVDNGKVETVTGPDVTAALAAGTHIPLGGDRALVTPEGQLHIIPKSQLQSALSAGYRVPVPGELDQFAAKARFADQGGLAAAAGAARGASFGLSDWLLTGHGVTTPEQLQGLKEYQPEASAAGEIAGAVGSALLAPEASPAGLVSKMGTGIAKRLAPEGAAAIRSIAGHAAGMAAEGAVYGAGNTVSQAALDENLLGDPAALAENLVANAGLGALLGGTLGGTFQAGKIALSGSVGAARSATSNLYQKLTGRVLEEGAPAAEAASVDAVAGQGPMPPGAEADLGITAQPRTPDPVFPPSPATARYGTAEAVGPELAGAQAGPAPAMAGAAEAAGPEFAAAGHAPELQMPRATSAAEAAGVQGAADTIADAGKPKFQSSPYSRMAATLTGKSEEDVLQDMEKGFNATPMSDLERKQHAATTAQSFEEHRAEMKKLVDATFRAREEETSRLISETANERVTEQEYARLINKASDLAATMRAQPESYAQDAAKKLEGIAQRLGKAAEGGERPAKVGPSEQFSRLNEAKRDLQKLYPKYTNKLRSVPEQDAGALLKEVSDDIQGSLENEGVWGSAGARQASFNDAYSKWRSADDILEKKFGERFGKKTRMSGTKFNTHFNAINDPVRAPNRQAVLDNYLATSRKLMEEAEKTHEAASFEQVDLTPLKEKLSTAAAQAKAAQNIVQKAPGGLGFFTDLFNPVGLAFKAAKGMKDPEKVAAMLSQIENANKKVGLRLSNGVEAVFKPAADVVKKGFGVLSEKLTPAERAEQIKKKIDTAREHVTSTENLVDALDRATRDGYEAAPKTMAAVQQTALRALQFLQSKAPSSDPSTPFERPLDPPADQLMAFERYHKAVHDPLSVLDELRSGALAPESVEALRTVYPNLYQQIGQAAIERAGVHKGEVPYRTRLLLSQFLGQPLDRSLTPAAMQTAAAAAQVAQAKQGGGAPHPTAKGMQHMNVAGRMATDFQKTSLKEA